MSRQRRVTAAEGRLDMVHFHAWPDPDQWRSAAACGNVDSALFFPAGTTGAAAKEVNEAKAVCATCSVRSPCLQFALTTNQEFGVWGGSDEKERRALRRRRRAEGRR